MRTTAAFTLATLAFLSTPAGAFAEAGPQQPRVGDTYEITRIQETESHGTDGSSATTYDKDRLVERVVAVRAEGLELEYDLPAGTRKEERALQWQLPARVLRPPQGPLRLLDRAAAEARVDAWLKATELPRKACGHWYFAWNAFQVECDPQSVIAIVQAFDPPVPDLREGALYRDPEAGAPAPLKRRSLGPSGATFVTQLPVDAEVVRRGRASVDVATGEISGKPVTLEAALRERAKDSVSGTISVTLEADAAGNVRRRIRVVKTVIRTPGGATETQTVTQTLERRRVEPRRPAAPAIQA